MSTLLWRTTSNIMFFNEVFSFTK